MVTAAALLDTQKGPIIGIFHEYAHFGKDKPIHAAGQMEWFNCKVDDRSKDVGGAQINETCNGYVIPLSIESGLVYMHSIRILLLIISSNIPMSSSPHLILGMLQFQTMALHLPYVKKSTKKVMIPYFRILSLMNGRTPTLSDTTIEYILGFKIDRIWGAYISIITMLNKMGNQQGLTLVGNLNRSFKTLKK